MTQSINTLLDRIGRRLASRLRAECSGYKPYTPSDVRTLCRYLKTGDVLLVEGNSKISSAIKYLTQSTLSHAALYVGDKLPEPEDGSERPRLIEVNVGEGCVAVPLSKYASYNTRICRAKGLLAQDREAVADFMVERLGLKYDMRNIFDLLRYFFPTPPVPLRWRRRMIAFGSGDPTRAICSSLIAQAFQSARYPILPKITKALDPTSPNARFPRREILHIRHHSLFAPRDFDLSPYFEIVKPKLAFDFDYKSILWADKIKKTPGVPAAEPREAEQEDQYAMVLDRERPAMAEQDGNCAVPGQSSMQVRNNVLILAIMIAASPAIADRRSGVGVPVHGTYVPYRIIDSFS